MLKLVKEVAAERRKRVSTGQMNRFLEKIDFQRATVPAANKMRIFYMTQAAEPRQRSSYLRIGRLNCTLPFSGSWRTRFVQPSAFADPQFGLRCAPATSKCTFLAIPRPLFSWDRR